ncbi:hypothetical protein CYY_007264 [Polysphondylium violaceum]|uniref:Uncharacterized protein n=1 Tax=Polysphondylium violaceum TaxID=133409 RepID=A0A8J4PR80_9MYCE|nr:hypothetical protein CYY_007264 [Polysphondylium violaceum]
MVIMDHKFDGIQVEGQSQPSYLKNGNVVPNSSFQNSTLALSNGLSNFGNSLQSLPPQVLLIKDKIINRSYCVINDKNVIVDPQGQVISVSEKDQIKSPKGIKDNETGIDAFTSPTSSRYRSFSAPSAHPLNRRESFQASIDNFVSKFKRSHSTGEEPDFNDMENNTHYINYNNDHDENDSDKREIILSDSESQSYRKERKMEKEELEEMMKKMRSLSLTSLDGYMKSYNCSKAPPTTPNENELDNYEKLSHLEYQERMEREELERIEKNAIIITQSNQDNYHGLDIYDPHHQMESPKSYPNTPKSQSPIPTMVVGSPNGRSSPSLLKRSLSSQLHLSKSSSSSKINVSTIQEQEEVAVDNSNRLSPRKILPLTKSNSYQSVSNNNNSSSNSTPTTPIPIISISSPSSRKEQQSTSTSTSTSLNSSSNSVKSTSSPKPFKRLTSKLSHSAQSLPKVELNQSQQNIPTTNNSSNNKKNNNNSLVKCPSGTSIEKLKKKNNSNNNNNNNNNNLNAFQLELMQHLKSKKEQTTSS